MKQRFQSVICADLCMTKKENGKTLILLMRRFNTGNDDGTYELPGGHLEANEDIFDAMIRETEEELLVKIDRADLRIIHIMHHYNGGRINFIFNIDGSNLEPKIGEPSKCDALAWFDINEIPQNTSDKMKKIINNIINDKFYDSL